MRKRLLIVLPYVPYPLESGGQIAVFEMIDYLRDKLDISIVIPSTDSVAALQEVWSNVAIYSYKQTLKEKVFKNLARYAFETFIKLYSSLLGSASAQPMSYQSFSLSINNSLVNLINDLIKNKQFDFLQVEFYELLPLICFVPDSIQRIFIHHELRYIRNERTESVSNTNSILREFFIQQNKGQEIGFLKKYDKIVTVSETDKNLLSQHIDPSKIFASPLAIRAVDSQNNPYRFNNKIFLLGGSDHMPNVNGLAWFMQNCWPIIAKENKDLRVVVIGAWDEANMKLYNGEERIEFLGFVKDLASIFNNGILAVPLKIGSGMRMKIIDAVNHNTPFVTTKVGVEGLLFEDEIDCFIADSGPDFAAKLLKLTQSQALQQSFIAHSKAVLEENYGYTKLVKVRENIYF